MSDTVKTIVTVLEIAQQLISAASTATSSGSSVDITSVDIDALVKINKAAEDNLQGDIDAMK